MPNLFEGLREGGGIFINESVLSPEFQPDLFYGREKELTEIAFQLKPLIEDRKNSYLLIFGPPGTGKTSCVNHVMRELKEFSSSVECIYVNCWTHSTRQSVLTRASHVLGAAIPRRGLSSDEVFDSFSECLKKSGKKTVIALDEVDRLFFNGQEKLLYDFTRNLSENLSIIFLTNDKTVFSKLDDRAKSSLSLQEVEFARYSPDELKKILFERAEKAFKKNACPKEVTALCAAFASKHGGDARIAIDCLWLAGRNAEKRGVSVIAEEDCRLAFKSQEKISSSQSKRLAGLSLIETKILERLNGKAMASGELYGLLSEYSDRILRTYVNLLANKKLVDVKEIDAERGKTRIITPLV